MQSSFFVFSLLLPCLFLYQCRIIGFCSVSFNQRCKWLKIDHKYCHKRQKCQRDEPNQRCPVAMPEMRWRRREESSNEGENQIFLLVTTNRSAAGVLHLPRSEQDDSEGIDRQREPTTQVSQSVNILFDRLCVFLIPLRLIE